VVGAELHIEGGGQRLAGCVARLDADQAADIDVFLGVVLGRIDVAVAADREHRLGVHGERTVGVGQIAHRQDVEVAHLHRGFGLASVGGGGREQDGGDDTEGTKHGVFRWMCLH